MPDLLPTFPRARHVGLRGLLATAVLALAACSSGVRLDDRAAPVENRTAPAPQGAGAAGTGGSATGGGAAGGADTNAMGARQVQSVQVAPLDPMNDPANPLSKRSIHFDFDSFVIKDEYRPVLDAHARLLNSQRNRKVLIQGNTDERGSREYNLALGQKRAEAVRRALASLGVPDAQMEAVSLGEEKPRASGSDEASWAENRRADLAYPND